MKKQKNTKTLFIYKLYKTIYTYPVIYKYNKMENIVEGIIDENLCVNFRIVRALILNDPTFRVFCMPRRVVPESWKELMKRDYEFECHESPEEHIPDLPTSEDDWLVAYNNKLQEAVQSINETIIMLTN